MVRISQRDIEALTEGFSPTINNVTDEQTDDCAAPRPGLKCEVLAPDGTLYDLAALDPVLYEPPRAPPELRLLLRPTIKPLTV